MSRALLALLLAVVPASTSRAQEGVPGVTIDLVVERETATVGEEIPVRLTLDLAPGVGFEPAPLGPELGPFTIVGETWLGPETAASGQRRYEWRARIAAFRTGDLELPAIRVALRPQAGDTTAVETSPRTIAIHSVLDPAEQDPALADLKPPADVPPDLGALRTAGWLLGALLAGALALWWLHRRYGSRLAAARIPVEPFQRVAPDAWIYAELQKLLARRLAEQGEVELFFAELSRLLKAYLGGRYRVELGEHTTAEVPERLRQSGAEETWIGESVELLGGCDLVKFARSRPGVDDCRAAVERIYRIVDATKPAAGAGAA